jgi:hypothetical protein
MVVSAPRLRQSSEAGSTPQVAPRRLGGETEGSATGWSRRHSPPPPRGGQQAARWMRRGLTVVRSAANRPRPTHRWSLPPGDAPGPAGGAAPAVGSGPRGEWHPAGARLSPPGARFGLEPTPGSALNGGPQKGWVRSHLSYIVRWSRSTAAIYQGWPSLFSGRLGLVPKDETRVWSVGSDPVGSVEFPFQMPSPSTTRSPPRLTAQPRRHRTCLPP